MIIPKEELFKVWAPDSATWSPWVKPVLFAQLSELALLGQSCPWQGIDSSWAPAATGETAIIVDLPEQDSILMGLSLAARGFRPVPLYNTSYQRSAALRVGGIMSCLVEGGSALLNLSLVDSSPPAFLLDSQRLNPPGIIIPGDFDNRWACFPQDFPSAGFLKSHGVTSVLLVMRNCSRPLDDLAHVLLRWQQAGIRISLKDVSGESQSVEIAVQKPARFKSLWHRALVIMGLRRNSAGGFGEIIPIPHEGGAGFG